MKKIIIGIILITLVSCRVDIDYQRGQHSFRSGAILINENPNIKVYSQNGTIGSTSRALLGGTQSFNLNAIGYNLRQVASAETLRDWQATEVAISNNLAFVTYNNKDVGIGGGVVSFSYNSSGQLTVISSIELPEAQFNSIRYDSISRKLYMAGASADTRLGYTGGDRAFIVIVNVGADGKIAIEEPAIIYLKSYQATSIKRVNDIIYVTTGDGLNNTEGGLYKLNAHNLSFISYTPILHARSVTVIGTDTFVLAGETEVLGQSVRLRVYKNGEILSSFIEGIQWDAKSEIINWNNSLLITLNNQGVRLLDINGIQTDFLDQPGSDIEFEVSNSISVGEFDGNKIMWVANGEAGVFFYDINAGKILASEFNRVLAQDSIGTIGNSSANFVDSRGNLAFVAHGLGGLKVLSIARTLRTEPTNPSITVTGINWNNGNVTKTNAITVDGVTLRHNNNVPNGPNVEHGNLLIEFNKVVSSNVMYNGQTAIYTMIGIGTQEANGYWKTYDLRVAFFNTTSSRWIVYDLIITVDNPGGNQLTNYVLPRIHP
jgi:hypothetical protein